MSLFTPDQNEQPVNPVISDIYGKTARSWTSFIEYRLQDMKKAYPGGEISVNLPAIADHAAYSYVMNFSYSQIMNELGMLGMRLSSFRQTAPQSALFAAVMAQALSQVEGIAVPQQVLDLGSGDGSLGIAFALCGFNVKGIEIDRKLIDHTRQNLQLLNSLGVKFSQPIEFVQDDMNNHLQSDKPNIWVNWPWRDQIDPMRSLFAKYAQPGSLLISMSMGGDILDYVEGKPAKPLPDYFYKLRPLGSRLNWAQATTEDFASNYLEWWGHLGSYDNFDAINDNWSIILKE